MYMLRVGTFTCDFNEWKSIYDGEHHLGKQLLKDDIFGEVSENSAIIKYTVTDQDKMNHLISERIPEIALSIDSIHEVCTLTQIE